MLTTFDLDEYVYEALRAGANGFMLKDVPRAVLIEGIRTVAAGDSLLAPAITRRLIERYVASRLRPRGPPLSWTTSAPARARYVAPARPGAAPTPRSRASSTSVEATVKTHVAGVLRKLGLRDRVQAVVWAYEFGLVRPGERLT